jgi:hypothetical protein
MRGRFHGFSSAGTCVDSTDFVGIFEVFQEIFEAIGERLCEIVLRRKHSPDRCSDSTIAHIGSEPRDKVAEHVLVNQI